MTHDEMVFLKRYRAPVVRYTFVGKFAATKRCDYGAPELLTSLLTEHARVSGVNTFHSDVICQATVPTLTNNFQECA